MRRVLVLNGPNLNLLGTREPEVYGATTLIELERLCREWGAAAGFGVQAFQSNHEGELIDWLHGARDNVVAVVINPGALTHYSYALHDAIVAVGIPTAEVHISNVKEREDWRRRSVVAPACSATIYGRGIHGYRWALEHLAARLAWPAETLPYGEDVDQVGDLRVPPGPGPHPVAVLLHGGFWRHPWQRDLMDGPAVDLARAGYATWNVEYRRVGAGGGWPTTLRDAGAAVDHVAHLAADRDVDPEQVVVVGHSAGGQLALWAAGRSGLGDGAPGAGPRVRPTAVVTAAPLADLSAAYDAGLGDGAVEDFLRRSPTEGAERYRMASPAARLPLGVPQVIVHGSADGVVPVDHSRAYAAAASAAGDEATLVELPDVGHFAPLDPRSRAWMTVRDEVGRLLPVGE